MLKSCVGISALPFNSHNRYTNLQTCNIPHQVGSNAHSVDKCFKGVPHEANFVADLDEFDELGRSSYFGGSFLSCLLGLLFHLDDGGSMILQNTSARQHDITSQAIVHLCIVGAAKFYACHVKIYLEC